jgi:hypothetical protein
VSWIQTYTGKKFDPLNPRAEDIDILDIAHALSNACRFSGHVKVLYSVAEHSLWVADLLKSWGRPPMVELWGLLHDASEAYLCDVPKPIKPHLTNYGEIEARVMLAVCERFDLPPSIPQSVHEADWHACVNEARQLLIGGPLGWDDPAVPFRLVQTNRAFAKRDFLSRFSELASLKGDAQKRVPQINEPNDESEH